LQVRDFGVGISEDDLKHIFKRFYKSSNALNQQLNPYGNGIGLSIAKIIAQTLNGDLTAES
jgi:signal transduction histidine kinase